MGKRLRIWSAGCSSGEEPYSTVMTIQESVPDWQQHDVRVLATDLDSEVLARARRGVYAEDRVRALPQKRLATFFREQKEAEPKRYRIIPELAELITFKQLNLMHELPMRGPIDVIFCRNVVIYFDKDTRRELFRRFALLQRPGDVLFLGHSESMFNICDAYTLVGRTIYRRNES
jgi:chemotaxis protein methyltransferase CheR